jgi:hypothetical protein
MGEGEIPEYSDYESDIAEGGGKGRPPSALAEYARRESTSSVPSFGRRDSDATKVDPGSQIQKDQMNVGMPVSVLPITCWRNKANLYWFRFQYRYRRRHR